MELSTNGRDKQTSALAARIYYEKMKNDEDFMNKKRLRAKEYKKKLREIKKAEKKDEPIIIELPKEPKMRGRPRKY